jgi:predicted nucleic acid-binding protein
MRSKFDVLVDSDAFVGRFYERDKHHPRAVALFEKFEKQRKVLVTTSAVVAETATVLSHREGQGLARVFLSIIRRSGLPIIHIDEKLHTEALTFFEEQEKRGTSFVDCANGIVAKTFAISQIMSFDEVYFKDWKLKQAA